MPWQLLLLLLILGLPLSGAILALALRRFLPERAPILIAALSLFLAAVAVIILVQLATPDSLLGQTVATPRETPSALRAAPTARWVQPPRTLEITATLDLGTTPSPTATAAAIPTTPTPTENPLSQVTVAVRNGTGESGLATRVGDLLENQGFRVVERENDRLTGERPHTLILDKGDHAEIRGALADLFEVPSHYVELNSEEPGDADIIIVLGDDFEMPTPPTATPTPTPTEGPFSQIGVAVRNGTGAPGLASNVAEELEKEGFSIVEIENDRLIGERPHTLILDKGDHPEARQALAGILNVSAAYIEVNSDEPGDADIIVILGDDFEE